MPTTRRRFGVIKGKLKLPVGKFRPKGQLIKVYNKVSRILMQRGHAREVNPATHDVCEGLGGGQSSFIFGIFKSLSVRDMSVFMRFYWKIVSFNSLLVRAEGYEEDQESLRSQRKLYFSRSSSGNKQKSIQIRLDKDKHSNIHKWRVKPIIITYAKCANTQWTSEHYSKNFHELVLFYWTS